MLTSKDGTPGGTFMSWYVVVALVIGCALGWLMYRRRNVTDEHRILKPFNPDDVRGRLETRYTYEPGLRSAIRKDRGSPPNY